MPNCLISLSAPAIAITLPLSQSIIAGQQRHQNQDQAAADQQNANNQCDHPVIRAVVLRLCTKSKTRVDSCRRLDHRVQLWIDRIENVGGMLLLARGSEIDGHFGGQRIGSTTSGTVRPIGRDGGVARKASFTSYTVVGPKFVKDTGAPVSRQGQELLSAFGALDPDGKVFKRKIDGSRAIGTVDNGHGGLCPAGKKILVSSLRWIRFPARRGFPTRFRTGRFWPRGAHTGAPRTCAHATP